MRFERKLTALRNGFEIAVSDEGDFVTLFISNSSGSDYAELVSKLLETKALSHKLSGSIDCYAIEIEAANKALVFSYIEEAWTH